MPWMGGGQDGAIQSQRIAAAGELVLDLARIGVGCGGQRGNGGGRGARQILVGVAIGLFFATCLLCLVVRKACTRSVGTQ